VSTEGGASRQRVPLSKMCWQRLGALIVLELAEWSVMWTLFEILD
jgi:hypothetical protein